MSLGIEALNLYSLHKRGIVRAAFLATIRIAPPFLNLVEQGIAELPARPGITERWLVLQPDFVMQPCAVAWHEDGCLTSRR